MITIKGYNAVNHETFQGLLFDAYKRSNKTYFTIAQEIKVNSTQTPINALTSQKQTVSDSILTATAKCLGINGFIMWYLGEKHYYIKNN